MAAKAGVRRISVQTPAAVRGGSTASMATRVNYPARRIASSGSARIVTTWPAPRSATASGAAASAAAERRRIDVLVTVLRAPGSVV